ncbi:ArsC/Spx/MgsR family protein [Flammeovirgaceae bacterium SG7u.111]|nr:ArsC/Spx/MgsR family protein [Flammeovirgaceae bacterium SG7u.132]WPO38414.1 ArsC/Spx/MgsR family protein [Flammeovirgaceae bacterium SG7u.111]
MIENHNNEVVIYYNSNHSVDKEVIAYAQTHFRFVRTVNVIESRLTGTRLTEIASRLGMPLDYLVCLTSDAAKTIGLDFGNMDDIDLIKLLQHYPDLIKSPIVISKNKAVVATGAKDIYEMAETYSEIM